MNLEKVCHELYDGNEKAGLDALDYPTVAVWVLKDNKRAIRFYEKCGFRLDEREEEIKLCSPIAEVRMIRKN